MVFKEKLKELRLKKNLTQIQLADILNVSRKTISSWENGRNYPDIQALINISDFFEISLDSLLKEDTVMTDKLIDFAKLNQRDGRLFKISYVIAVILTGLHFMVTLLHIKNMDHFWFSNVLDLVYIVSVVVLMTHLPLTFKQIKVWFATWDHIVLSLLLIGITLFVNFNGLILFNHGNTAYDMGYVIGISMKILMELIVVFIVAMINPKKALASD